jgi:hypothetical protein
VTLMAFLISGTSVGSVGGIALRHLQRAHPSPPTVPAQVTLRPPKPSWAQRAPSRSAAPTPTASTAPVPAEPGLPPGANNVTPSATVAAPAQAPRQAGEAGVQPASATALRDGLSTTVWRHLGDATGVQFVLRFAQPVTVTAVGLDPGDDTDGPELWSAYRRVSLATVSFPDGVSRQVQFDTSTALLPAQRPQVWPLLAKETTDTVTLRIDATDAFSSGSADLTAVSDLYVLIDR